MSSCQQSELPISANGPRDAGASKTRADKAIVVIVTLLVAAYWIGMFLSLRPGVLRGVTDFSGFYAAGKMVLTGHSSEVYYYPAEVEAQRPFVVEGRSPVLPFVFAPYSLAIFAPLAALPYGQAVLIWFCINVGFLLAIPFLLQSRLHLTDKQIALALISMAFFYPLSVTLAQGQMTPSTVLLFTITFLSLSNGRDFRAGAALAVALYKPQFVLSLLLVFLFTKNWKALRGFGCACLALFGASLVLVGWRAAIGFPAAMLQSAKLPANIGEPGAERMANIRGLLQWLLDAHMGHHSVLLIAGAASALLIMGLLIVMLQQPTLSELGFALVILVTVLASYHCYMHDMGLIILALFLVGHYLTVQERTTLRVTLGVSACVVLISSSMLPPPVTVALVLLFTTVLTIEYLGSPQGKTSDEPSTAAPGFAAGGIS